jgi:hypothetical protein
MAGTNGSATLGDIHKNAERIRGLQDLSGVRTQLAEAQKALADEKNARADLREILIQINRMVGGQGWTDPSEVKAAVQRRLDKHSNGRTAELEASLEKQDAVEKQLRSGLEHEKRRADQAVETAGKIRQELGIAKQDLLMSQTNLKNAQIELERFGRMKLAAEKPPMAIAVAPLTNDERDALIALIDMEREDHSKLVRDILQAAADASAEVRAGLLSDKNSARGIKAQNQGLLYGSAAVERAITRVIHNIKPKDIEQDNG